MKKPGKLLNIIVPITLFEHYTFLYFIKTLCKKYGNWVF